MYLIVGLGNPGKEYENTRHNLGFKVIDELSSRCGVTSLKNKCRAFTAEISLNDHRVILAQPQTYMNESGAAVRELADWFKVSADKIVVIFDDMDLEVGQIRIREKGSAGGHHGVESVMDCLGTSEFCRIRIGIGRENFMDDGADYVLSVIPSSQRAVLEEAVIRAVDAVEMLVADGLPAAMNYFND